MASSKRDQLINTAQELFYREGYHATGIDRILAESGVAKMTLYKHFRSKDELIQAVLQSREQSVLGQLAALRASAPAREAVLQVFEGLHAWVNQADFCGCSFIKSTTLTTRTFKSGKCSRKIDTAASVSSVGTSPQHAMTTSVSAS